MKTIKDKVVRLGQLVKVNAVIEPQKRQERHREANFLVRRWVRREVQQTGIVVGVRVVKEGTVYFDDDSGPSFWPTMYTRAYLIAPNLRGLFLARPEDVEVAS